MRQSRQTDYMISRRTAQADPQIRKTPTTEDGRQGVAAVITRAFKVMEVLNVTIKVDMVVSGTALASHSLRDPSRMRACRDNRGRTAVNANIKGNYDLILVFPIIEIKEALI